MNQELKEDLAKLYDAYLNAVEEYRKENAWHYPNGYDTLYAFMLWCKRGYID